MFSFRPLFPRSVSPNENCSEIRRIGRKSLSSGLPLVFASLLIVLAGCSSDQGRLTMISSDEQRVFSQDFTEAYIAHSPTGDADIVLLQDDMQPLPQDPTRPLRPDPCDRPKQLVHIRVFWTPMLGVKPDHPANTNASIHWTMICDHANAGVIDYSGSGLVELSESKTSAAITIRRAWMKQDHKSGDMTDPLGNADLRGSFTALQDPEKVQAVMAEIKLANATATAEAQAAAPVGVAHD